MRFVGRIRSENVGMSNEKESEKDNNSSLDTEPSTNCDKGAEGSECPVHNRGWCGLDLRFLLKWVIPL